MTEDTAYARGTEVDQATVRQDYLEIVDTLLLAVAGRSWELDRLLTPSARTSAHTSWPSEELHSSPLGQSLLIIVDAACGTSTVPQTVERAMQRVYRALFGDSVSDGFRVPPTFYTSPLSRLFHAAARRMYRPEDLLTPSQVCRLLGVSRQSVYDRMDEGKLTPIAVHGKRRFLRPEVEAWQVQRALGRNAVPDAEHPPGRE